MAQITFTLPTELAKALKKQADTETRTVSNLLQVAVQRYLDNLKK